MRWFKTKREAEAPERRPIRWCDKCGYQEWPRNPAQGGLTAHYGTSPFGIRYIAKHNHMQLECSICGALSTEPTLATLITMQEKAKRKKEEKSVD